jgi:hypothetical protein
LLSTSRECPELIKSIFLVGGGFIIGAIVGCLVPRALARCSRKGVLTILGFVDAPMLVLLGLLVALWVYAVASGAVHIQSVLAALFVATVGSLGGTWVLLWSRWDASRRD